MVCHLYLVLPKYLELLLGQNKYSLIRRCELNRDSGDYLKTETPCEVLWYWVRNWGRFGRVIGYNPAHSE